MRLLEKPAATDPGFDPKDPNPSTSWAPHRVQHWQFKPHAVDGLHPCGGAGLGGDGCEGTDADAAWRCAGDRGRHTALEAWVKFSPTRQCRRVWPTLWPGTGVLRGLSAVALLPDLNHCTVAVIGLAMWVCRWRWRCHPGACVRTDPFERG